MNRHLKIFVVEDNPFYQKLIMKTLESVSKDVQSFTTGEDCLREIYKDPAIVVIDYVLDGEMNGIETIQEIRATDSTAFIILFSTEPDLITRQELADFGSFELLEKSVQTLPLLKNMIESYTDAVFCY